MPEFTLETGSVAIGDPVMGLARYSVSLSPGRYALEMGALKQIDGTESEENRLPLIDLDGPCIYILDASKIEQFETAFHEVGKECSYMMMEMQNRHKEIEQKTGAQIGFYWEEKLAGASREGRYVFDTTRIRHIQ